MQGNYLNMGFFTVFSTPFIISLFLRYSPQSNHDEISNDESSFFDYLFLFQALHFIIVWTTLFFGDNSSCFNLVILLSGACLTLFVLPLIILIVTIAYFSHPSLDDSLMKTWFLISLVLEALALLLGVIWAVMQCFCKRDRALEGKDGESQAAPKAAEEQKQSQDPNDTNNTNLVVPNVAVTS